LARIVRLLLFEGPGEVDRLSCAIVGRQWTVLVNVSEAEADHTWPNLSPIWRKKDLVSVYLSAPESGAADREEVAPDRTISGGDWELHIMTDERRPGRRMVIVETGQSVIGLGAVLGADAPPSGRTRALLLDASWTHVSSFPEREQVRSAMTEALKWRGGTVHFVSDIQWDVDLFESVARELGRESNVAAIHVKGTTARKLWQARQALPTVALEDHVLIGLAPGRDERGLFQRLRSDFAERCAGVLAFPNAPLCTGPGMSRDEALEAVGLWLPTQVLVGAGQMSEQVLLARYLQESTGGSPMSAAVGGGEYRLPDFELIRHNDLGGNLARTARIRAIAARHGLVVVAYGRGEDEFYVSGIGLPESQEDILPRIKISRRDKTPEQVVREVETAFSSRGLPVPAVRLLG
jgi:hypothetical protein